MPAKIVIPDPPFFDTKLLHHYCTMVSAELVIYKDLAVDAKQLQARIHDADIIIVDILSTYDETSLKGCTNLKYLISASIGLNHIDLEYCKKHSINVSNFIGYNARAVAEMAFANLISLLRHVPGANLSVRSNLWLTDYFEGEELEGKTLGVIGAGNIGRELIRIGQGFGMRVLCHTKHPTAARARALGLNNFSTLNMVLSSSDFVVLAVPATAETKGMINRSTLARMKPISYLINEGRYNLVDIHALARALYNKKIAGVALDFLGPEPYTLYNHDLEIQEMANRPNVIVTPHIGFNTHEAMERLTTAVCKRVEQIVGEAYL